MRNVEIVFVFVRLIVIVIDVVVAVVVDMFHKVSGKGITQSSKQITNCVAITYLL